MTQIVPRLSVWAKRAIVREMSKCPTTTLKRLQRSLAETGDPVQTSAISSASQSWPLWESDQKEVTFEKS